MSGGSEEQAPPEVRHYRHRGEVPWDIQGPTNNKESSYWAQRHQIFSKYEEGIWLTDDAWFGVTPEPVANKIAEHVEAAAPDDRVIVVDAFAGAGGNTIAFAKSGRWKRVYGIEKDPAVLACAKHNAKIYGVADRITWFLGDCFELLKNQLKDLGPYSVVFASPPWGGPGYRCDEIFNLRTMEPYSLNFLYEQLSAFSEHVVLYLPRSSDIRQLAKFGKDDKKTPVVHYCMDGASKAMCVYYGGFKENALSQRC